MQDYGFLSVVPPLLTIIVAIYSRNVILALIIGILSGSMIITGYNPLAALLNSVEEQVLKEIAAGTQVQVILAIMIIGGWVSLRNRIRDVLSIQDHLTHSWNSTLSGAMMIPLRI